MKTIIKIVVAMFLVVAFVVKAGEFGQGTMQNVSSEAVNIAKEQTSTMSTADMPSSLQTESTASQPQALSDLDEQDVSESITSEQLASSPQDMTMHEVSTSPETKEELERQIEGYTQEATPTTSPVIKEDVSQTVSAQTEMTSSVMPTAEQESKAIQPGIEKIEESKKETESTLTEKPAVETKKTMKCICDVE